MNRVLSRDQIRAFDRHAIETCHVPGLVLMENAGRGAAELVHARAGGAHAPVAVVCGAGNNGGDGFVVARHLLAWGHEVRVWLVGDASRIRGDARVNHDAWVGLGGGVRALCSLDDLGSLESDLAAAAVVVDALFGTGLDRDVGEPFASVLAAMSRAHAFRVALDLPSGLDSSSGRVLGAVFEADLTITFGALKLGMLTPSGAEHCGEIHVASLGVPLSILDHTGHDGRLVVSSEVGSWIAPRRAGAHKHAAGSVLVVAGSAGKLGASLLVANGALRAGAGLATVASWPEAVDALDSRVLEVMTARIEPDRIESSLAQALEGRRAVAIGPGFGTNERARRVVDEVVLGWDGVKVVDADALTLFAGRAEALAGARGRAILTPHPGEMARLLGTASADVERDRFGAVREAARRTRAIVVLKGAHTLIANGTGPVWINASGSPALAAAGAGDVLCGIVAALCCSMPPELAAVAGVHVHGLAGEAWAHERRVDRGMLAGEIADKVPEVLAKLMGSEDGGTSTPGNP
jgi:NAD(P)H-hydrate epimerase